MIGLSLSMCIKDIMAGRVDERDVSKIITSTCAETEAHWEHLYAQYRQTYWRDAFAGAAAVEMVKRLRAQGKIEQPRLTNPDYFHSIAGGWWTPEATCQDSEH